MCNMMFYWLNCLPHEHMFEVTGKKRKKEKLSLTYLSILCFYDICHYCPWSSMLVDFTVITDHNAYLGKIQCLYITLKWQLYLTTHEDKLLTTAVGTLRVFKATSTTFSWLMWETYWASTNKGPYARDMVTLYDTFSILYIHCRQYISI